MPRLSNQRGYYIGRFQRPKGQDSISCDGDCNTWLHRGCAGLSKKAFRALKDSEKPFYCVSCRLSIHSDEIESLKSSLKLLQEEMGSLKSSINVVDGGTSPPVPPSHTATAGSVSTVSRPVLQKTSHPSKAPDRKFNIVVYGLDESVQGTSRRERKLQDTKKVEDVIQVVNSKVSSQSIRDCVRLGKYKAFSSRPRPLLVNLNRVSDVHLLLSNRKSLQKPLAIKPDLPLEKRITEATLLKQRWALIQSGTSASSIKIRDSKLYVDESFYGSASGSIFSPANQTDANTPSKSPPPSVTTPSIADCAPSTQ